MRKDPAATLLKKERWGSYFRFTLESPSIARDANPGQFVMVKVRDASHPLLRRPFSIHAQDKETISLFFSVAGLGTEILAARPEGDRLDLLGPLGKGFPLDKPASEDSRALLVGGGRGIAPLYFLASELHALGHKVLALYGGRTAEDLPLKNLFLASCWETRFSTDDGSQGFKGLVTELMKAELETYPADRIYACGPDPMLQEVGRFAGRRSIPASLSLEAHMGCGFGACWGCVKKIRTDSGEELVKVCEDGPVFPAEKVVWGED